MNSKKQVYVVTHNGTLLPMGTAVTIEGETSHGFSLTRPTILEGTKDASLYPIENAYLIKKELYDVFVENPDDNTEPYNDGQEDYLKKEGEVLDAVEDALSDEEFLGYIKGNIINSLSYFCDDHIINQDVVDAIKWYAVRLEKYNNKLVED
jgi:hypothetical protein